MGGFFSFMRHFFQGDPDSSVPGDGGGAGGGGPSQVPARRRIFSGLRGKAAQRNEQQMAALQAGYQEIVGMVQSIRGHLESQTRTQEKMLGLMDRLGDAAEGLKGITQSAEQQTATLQLIRDQMGHSVEHGQQMVDSLNRFNATLTLIDQSSRGTVNTLTGLVDRMRESEHLLRSNLERAEKRMVVLIGALVVAILLAIAAALYFNGWGRPAPAESVPVPIPTAAWAPAPLAEPDAPPPALEPNVAVESPMAGEPQPPAEMESVADQEPPAASLPAPELAPVNRELASRAEPVEIAVTPETESAGAAAPTNAGGTTPKLEILPTESVWVVLPPGVQQDFPAVTNPASPATVPAEPVAPRDAAP